MFVFIFVTMSSLVRRSLIYSPSFHGLYVDSAFLMWFWYLICWKFKALFVFILVSVWVLWFSIFLSFRMKHFEFNSAALAVDNEHLTMVSEATNSLSLSSSRRFRDRFGQRFLCLLVCTMDQPNDSLRGLIRTGAMSNLRFTKAVGYAWLLWSVNKYSFCVDKPGPA